MSPTQRGIPADAVERMVHASFSPALSVTASRELDGGGFASVLRVDLSDGQTIVLKVAPAPDVPLLGYEHGVTGAEARYLALVGREGPDIPVPQLLAYGSDPAVFASAWLFMSHVPGVPLSMLRDTHQPEQTDQVRADLGVAISRLHTLTGERFGYDDERPHADTWREAYLAMLESLLDDGRRWKVDLGIAPEAILDLVKRHGGVLDAVDRPALLHFDLWDGNLLCVPDADDGLRLNGLVDGERYLFGDPLMDFVSPTLFRHIEDEPGHPFLRGYGLTENSSVAFDAAALRRLTLYRLHFYLLMTIEMPSRGITQQEQPDRYRKLSMLVERQLSEMAKW